MRSGIFQNIYCKSCHHCRECTTPRVYSKRHKRKYLKLCLWTYKNLTRSKYRVYQWKKWAYFIKKNYLTQNNFQEKLEISSIYRLPHHSTRTFGAQLIGCGIVLPFSPLPTSVFVNGTDFLSKVCLMILLHGMLSPISVSQFPIAWTYKNSRCEIFIGLQFWVAVHWTVNL